MEFNELNSVEHYIIHQISGVNLNNKGVSEPVSTYGVQRHNSGLNSNNLKTGTKIKIVRK